MQLGSLWALGFASCPTAAQERSSQKAPRASVRGAAQQSYQQPLCDRTSSWLSLNAHLHENSPRDQVWRRKIRVGLNMSDPNQLHHEISWRQLLKWWPPHTTACCRISGLPHASMPHATGAAAMGSPNPSLVKRRCTDAHVMNMQNPESPGCLFARCDIHLGKPGSNPSLCAGTGAAGLCKSVVFKNKGFAPEVLVPCF